MTTARAGYTPLEKFAVERYLRDKPEDGLMLPAFRSADHSREEWSRLESRAKPCDAS